MKLNLCTALLAAATILAPFSLAAEKAQNPADAKRAAVEVYGKLPLSFEPTESSARFLAHSGGYSIFVGARESAVAVTDAKSGKTQMLRFAFDNANLAAPLDAIEPQPGVTNYYIGQDSRKWRLGVKNYAKVRAQGVYPGVDVVYYGDHRRLEFDFVVAPKADPRAIALSFSGMQRLYKDASGDLVAEVNGQPVRFVKPYAYQKVAGVSKPVAVDYELAAAGSVHLRVGDYDSNAELIIDPVVSYAIYLGGSSADIASGIVVDSSGNAYVTGTTSSSDFPDVLDSNPLPHYQVSKDAYVVKYSADGKSYVYTAIFGGSPPIVGASSGGFAEGNGIALDSSNQAYIIGATNFTDLPGAPTTAGYSLNKYQGGDSDAFITILDANGNLLRTSYLGGSSADLGYGIAVDSSRNVIAVGETCSQNFPGYNAFQTKIENCVGFITKLDNALNIGVAPGNGASALSYLSPFGPGTVKYFFSEFFGGQLVAPWPTASWFLNTDYVAGAIIVDPNGNVQIASNDGTTSFALPSATTWTWAVSKYGTTADGSISWVNQGPSVLPIFADSIAYGVALDVIGDIFVAGGTTSASLSPWSDYVGSGAWVLKVKRTGPYVYGTVLETNPSDSSGKVDTARAIAVDAKGQAYVTGTVTGTLHPAPALKSTVGGGQDAFLIRMSNSGHIDYASYLGGSGNDQGLGIAVDAGGSAYVTGSTQSGDFPLINPLTNPHSAPSPNATYTLSGAEDAFISKFTVDGLSLTFSAYLGGSASDQGNAIALDTYGQGDMYVAGQTSSSDLDQLDPVGYIGAQLAYGGGGTDAFVAKIAGASLDTVTVTPGSLSFSYQDVGIPSSASLLTYSIVNGTSNATISSIKFSNSDFAQENRGINDCSAGGAIVPAPIPPVKPPVPPALGYCDLFVVFTPSTQGPIKGTLTITDDTNSTAHLVSLSGEGASPYDVLSKVNLPFADQGVSTTSSAPQTVTLSNTGKGMLYISGITTSGDFSQTNTCGVQVPPNTGTCQIAVSFTPTSANVRNGSVTIVDNSLGSPHKINLTGMGVLVNRTVSASNLTFDLQQMNVPSKAQTIKVNNTDSKQTLVVGSVVPTGDYQVTTNTCTTPVPPSNSCTIMVVFNPTLPGIRAGTLTINDTGTPVLPSIALTGSAGASTTLTPTLGLTFAAPNNVGTTSPAKLVTLANLSAFPFYVKSVVISGSAVGEFSQTNNCGTSVLASGSCTVSVNFTPTATGNRNATLTVISDAASSPQSIALVGVGTAPLVGLSSLTPIFSDQSLNVPSAPSYITLTNTGSGPLNIPAGGITIIGTAASDFTQTNTCGTQVATGANCSINVVFTPSATYSRSATLNVVDDALPSPQTVALLGNGVLVIAPKISPSALSFPNQPLNQASAVQTVTVKNPDINNPLTLNTPLFTGDYQMVGQPGSCTTQLAKNSSCVIGVTFTPTAAGTRTGTLTISSNASSAPVVVHLTGIGGATSAAPGVNDYTLTPDAAGVSVTQGITAVYNFSVVPVSGFKDTIAFTCSGPVGSSCSVSPTSLTMDGTTTPIVKLYVNTTGGNGTTAGLIQGGFASRSIFLAVLSFSMMGMLLINKRRGVWLALMLLALCVAFGSLGCGGSGSGSTTSGLAPGSYEVVLTATSTGAVPVAHKTTLNLVVGKK